MEPVMGRKKVGFVVATPATALAFMGGHMRALGAFNDIVFIADGADAKTLDALGVQGAAIDVAIPRKISLLNDIKAWFGLFAALRKAQLDAVVSVTPKAGLLTMTAGWLAGVPVRVHWFTGQVWATRTGFGRVLLKALDRVTFWFSSEVLVDSPSQRDFLLGEGVVSKARSAVIADGSICGVDSQRFKPDAVARLAVRDELVIPPHVTVFMFLGRLAADKGIGDLAVAFERLARERTDVRLLLVGPDEESLLEALLERLGPARELTLTVPFTAAPERYIAACDIFCLPSYREGFGSSALEASAVGVPVVASRIYGLTDAVVEGETGLLHAARDVEALESAMRDLLVDPGRRDEMGRAGQARAIRDFSAERVTTEFAEFLRCAMGPPS
jgi:glycosyltransferase involved in cell wall biosynthesis